MSLSLSLSSRMLDSAQRTQILLAHSSVVLGKSYQIQLTGVSIPLQLPCCSFSSHAYQIVLKTKEWELFFSHYAPKKTGFLWLFYYLSIIITNKLTSIFPLDSIFGLQYLVLRLYFFMCSVSLFWWLSHDFWRKSLYSSFNAEERQKKCGGDHSEDL